MQTNARVTKRFCLVHGYVHPAGEMDKVTTAPDELHCVEEMWTNVVPLTADEYAEVSTEGNSETKERLIKKGRVAQLITGTEGPVPCKVVSVTPTETVVKVPAEHFFARGREVELTLYTPNRYLTPRTGSGPVIFVTDTGEVIR